MRKTKTDRVDARTIAAMLLSDLGLKLYTDTEYHNEELKSLIRYRFDKVRERAKLKQSVSCLVCILFPELEKLVAALHMNSVYALSEEFPRSKQIALANLTRSCSHNTDWMALSALPALPIPYFVILPFFLFDCRRQTSNSSDLPL